MPAFRFHARDRRGEPLNGTLTAPSVEMLTSELRGRGLLVLDVEPAAKGAPVARISLNPFSWLPPRSFDVESGFQQLAAMLRSGLSLLAGLRTVSEQARRPRVMRMWQDVGERIEEGSTFSGALAAHPKVFSTHVIQLVRVGEHAGMLDSSLLRAADHLERTRNLRLIVLNALTYPFIVVLMALGVAVFMVINVIPKIQKFLGGGGRRLPAITQTLVDVSSAVMNWLPYLLVALLFFVLALFFCYRWPPGRETMDGLLLRTPVTGRILRLSGTAVFARGLGILLESGVTLLDSLTALEHLLRNRVLSQRVAAARLAVLRGGTLAGALSGNHDFLPMLGRMVAVGESAGTLAPVLHEVAKFHENQLVITIRRMSVLVEPMLILVVGGIVGFVYTAFFIAVFSLAGGGR